MDHLGWRDALIALGAINLAFCVGLHVAVLDPSADPSVTATSAANGARTLARRLRQIEAADREAAAFLRTYHELLIDDRWIRGNVDQGSLEGCDLTGPAGIDALMKTTPA